ncbi:ABC transporter substrate-binding protein [Mesorhizobium sp.]|uniref:ABC transporter substrate-binding protein n=1 Tax=Mesorhizobium sp. TaxID=1871066 RepID=UPI00122A906A|nr:ABC transporter substrate-binding protein [Mesorhizobium sp.]TIL33981.1 MAG: ABC transporter substrate-binding protein [Mesorhizobium sp.]TIL54311.1 MAG: ABC transporter substrate-binding protein [Mesorhizobium sp.]
MEIVQSRRHFMMGLSAVGAAGLVNVPTSAHAEPAPETTTVRLPRTFRALCEAPKNIAGELLRAEGFTDVRYIDLAADSDPSAMLASGELDFTTDFPPAHIMAIEAGMPIKVVTGLHSGCLELIVTESINSISDLKGKRVGVFALTSAPHVLVTLMAAYVGLDPATDLEWVANPDVSSMQLFNEGKVDAFLAVPPEPQEQRVRKFGHTILNTTADRPWSQHYCCMLAGSADYVDRHPAATKRVLRAILKAADICASDPELAAQLSVDGKFTDRYDYALEGLREARYDVWQEFDPEDTMRFYALRMNEVGFIKAGPNKIIANGTDWRFLNEIKREMKT